MLKIKLKCEPRRFAECLVVPLGAGKTVKWNGIGSVVEFEDKEQGYKVLGMYSHCLEPVLESEKIEKSKNAAPRNKKINPQATT